MNIKTELNLSHALQLKFAALVQTVSLLLFAFITLSKMFYFTKRKPMQLITTHPEVKSSNGFVSLSVLRSVFVWTPTVEYTE